MPILSDVRLLPRLARRCAGFARQMLRDLEWHGRFAGPAFPPRTRRIAEQARLLVTSAVTAEDYYHHGLYRSSLGTAEKRAFLGWFEKTRYFRPLNPPVYDILARDKVLFHTLARSLEIPVPEIVATVAPGNAPSLGQRLTSSVDLRRFLSVPGRANLFLKPADGAEGEGALALGERVTETPSWRRLPGGEAIALEAVVRHIEAAGPTARFVIQRLLRPHPEMAEIVPAVCPTVRILTLAEDTAVVVVAAVLRLGFGRLPTDNFTGGGVVVPIDPESGMLGLAAYLERDLPRHQRTHPATGVAITGRVLPWWPEIATLARNAAAKMPYLRCIGWDVAVTDEGPLVMEANTHPRLRTLQLAHDRGLLAGPLGRALAPHDGIARSGLRVGGNSSGFGAPSPVTQQAPVR